MPEKELPDARFQRIAEVYGSEGARAIVKAVYRLIAVFGDDPILDAKEVSERLGCSRKTLQRLVSDGNLPSPILLRGNRRGWRKSAIDKWLAGRPSIHPE